MPYQNEKQVAIDAVTRAARLCRAVQSGLVKIDSLEKGDRSPVTVADFGSQALVCQHLKTNFPGDPIVAEEDSTDLQQPENGDKLRQVTDYVQQFERLATPQTICEWIDAGNGGVEHRFWTLDPIDGTKGFLRNEQYGIALALIEAGEVKIAALACPAMADRQDTMSDGELGVIFAAVRGQGAEMSRLDDNRFTPIRVVEASDKENLRFVESVESGHGDHRLQEAIAKAVGIMHPSLRMDSQAKYGAVARGDAALYLRLPSPKSPDYREKIWDHAAGSLIIEEAGGQVTDMDGRPLDFSSDYKMNNNRGVVASNGIIHRAVIEALAKHHR